MLSNLKIYRQATAGEVCTDKDCDLKRSIPAVRRPVKKHGITYDCDTPVPFEDNLAARATHADHLSPMASLFVAEAGRSVIGMSRRDVNASVVQLPDKYEDRLADPPLGERYQDCNDIASRRPGAEALAVHSRARSDLTGMGLEFRDPPFCGRDL